MSCIYKRKHRNGITWYIDYSDPTTGKRIRRAVGKKKEAEEKLAVIRLRIIRGQHSEIKIPIKIIEFAERYFKYSEQVNRLNTVLRDRGRFKAFLRYCKQNNIINLTDIRPNIISELQTKYLSTHARKSWNNLLTVIKAMLNKAVEWEIINYNPITRVKPLKIDTTFHYFTSDEVNLIIDNAREPLLTAIMILLYTGIRRGELWQLTWRDVDLRAKILHIKPSKDFSTKNRDMRSIPLAKPLSHHLSQKSRANKQRLCCDFASIHSIRRQFVRLLKSLGITGTLHDLRHTFASQLATNGVPIPAIKELLGHRDISTTMIYAHLSPDSYQKAIDKLIF